MKNILAISYDSDLGWANENLTKLQGEGRMARKRLPPKVRPIDPICICEVAGKFPKWFRAFSLARL